MSIIEELMSSRFIPSVIIGVVNSTSNYPKADTETSFDLQISVRPFNSDLSIITSKSEVLELKSNRESVCILS